MIICSNRVEQSKWWILWQVPKWLNHSWNGFEKRGQTQADHQIIMTIFFSSSFRSIHFFNPFRKLNNIKNEARNMCNFWYDHCSVILFSLSFFDGNLYTYSYIHYCMGTRARPINAQPSMIFGFALPNYLIFSFSNSSYTRFKTPLLSL